MCSRSYREPFLRYMKAAKPVTRKQAARVIPMIIGSDIVAFL